MMWRLTQGDPVPETRGRPGARWVRMATDFPAALAEIRRGQLSFRAYLRSLRGPVESAIYAWDDLLPALFEVPLMAYLMCKRGWI